MSDKTTSPAIYLAAVLFGVGYVLFMVLYVLPLFFPIILQGYYWLLWLIATTVGMPLGFIIYYVVTRAIGYEYKEWKQTLILFIPTLLFPTAFAFIFNLVLPLSFEPFRSLVLPVVVFAIAFNIYAKRRYPKKANSSM